MDAHPSLSPDAFADVGCAIWSDVNVLISGGDVDERKAVGRLIHERSSRHSGPFVVVERESPADLLTSTELVRKASGGTLFIEEAGALDRNTQGDLLRIIIGPAGEPVEAHAVRETRVIASTSYNLLRRLASREFRADLFYRLNVIHVVLGPVRGLPTARLM